MYTAIKILFNFKCFNSENVRVSSLNIFYYFVSYVCCTLNHFYDAAHKWGWRRRLTIILMAKPEWCDMYKIHTYFEILKSVWWQVLLLNNEIGIASFCFKTTDLYTLHSTLDVAMGCRMQSLLTHNSYSRF